MSNVDFFLQAVLLIVVIVAVAFTATKLQKRDWSGAIVASNE
jgi:hypothetical protein